jgi:hypothetical protein
MPKYAQVDLGQSPPKVVGFFDTDVIRYPNLPPMGQLVELTDADWAARGGGMGWVIIAGRLSPVGSPMADAAAALAARLAMGLTVTSASAPALNATYALDSLTMDQIGSVARDAGAGLGLPGDAGTFVYPDITGLMHAFTEPQLIALYRAMRNLLLALNTQAAMMMRGAPPNWPDQTAILD